MIGLSPLQYSHHDSMPLIENLSSQGFKAFQEDVFKFFDLIYGWLEASYLASPFANNNLISFLMFAKNENTYEDAFTRSFRGLFHYCYNRKGKVAGWLRLCVMAHLPSFRRYL